MVANGHLFKWAHDVEQLTDFKVRNMLFANNGKGVFQNITTQAGDGMAIIESSRGLALDDLDNDGDIDALISNSDAPANVLLNQTQSSQTLGSVSIGRQTIQSRRCGSQSDDYLRHENASGRTAQWPRLSESLWNAIALRYR